jgi:hypothetical protein
MVTITVLEYLEHADKFECEVSYTTDHALIDAGALACMTGMFDEPHEFIGLTFTVQMQEVKA